MNYFIKNGQPTNGTVLLITTIGLITAAVFGFTGEYNDAVMAITTVK